MGLPFQRIAISRLFAPEIEAQSQSPPDLGIVESWAATALQRGADALVLREPGLPAPAVRQAVSRLRRAAGQDIPLMLNVQLVDLPAGADGIHLPSGSILPPAAFPGRNFWMGKSCHSLEELQAAEARGFDYAFLSPVFPTATHPGAEAMGVDTLAAWARQVLIPVVALGGITPGREAACLEAGAAAVAAIGWFAS